MRSMIQPLSMAGLTSLVATLRPLRKMVIASETFRISSRKWEMKMMLRPPSRSLARTANKRSISGGDNAEVGSSRMMMRAPENNTRDEFDELLDADRKIAEARARVDVEPEIFQLRGGALGHPPPGDDAEAIDRLTSEEDIFGDAQFRRDAELLMDHPDPGGQRIARRAEMHVLSVDAHAPGVGGVDAGDDLHHRALARAVLAGQTMDLTGGEREVDAAKRLDAAERLRDARHFEQRHAELSRTVQMRNCSCIQSMPSALALVTTGPSVTMFFGMSVPVLAP